MFGLREIKMNVKPKFDCTNCWKCHINWSCKNVYPPRGERVVRTYEEEDTGNQDGPGFFEEEERGSIDDWALFGGD